MANTFNHRSYYQLTAIFIPSHSLRNPWIEYVLIFTLCVAFTLCKYNSYAFSNKWSEHVSWSLMKNPNSSANEQSFGVRDKLWGEFSRTKVTQNTHIIFGVEKITKLSLVLIDFQLYWFNLQCSIVEYRFGWSKKAGTVLLNRANCEFVIAFSTLFTIYNIYIIFLINNN